MVQLLINKANEEHLYVNITTELAMKNKNSTDYKLNKE